MSERQSGDVREDLGFLRKNEGFSERRIENTPIVRELLQAEPGESFERSKSRFISAVHSLQNDEATLLLDIFALTPATQSIRSLSERRTIHGRSISRGIDTVAARESIALDHLTTRLITGTYAQSPVALDVPEMHDGLIYEQTTTLFVVKDRRWHETIEHYRFVAAFDEMDTVRVTRSYPALVSTKTGGEFRVRTLPASRGETDHFWHLDATRRHDEPMRRGGSYDLRFKVQPSDDRSRHEQLSLISRAFHERSLLATIRVQFIGERPTLLWTHERVSYFDSPGFPSKRNIRQLDDEGVALLRMRDVHGGLFSGMAWRFDEP